MTLDREVDPATSYIKVRTKNDLIGTFEVDHVEGRKIYLKDSSSIQQEGDTVNITAVLFPEMENCPYICGKVTEKPKLYRCIEITRTVENIRHIVAVEHIPDIFLKKKWNTYNNVLDFSHCVAIAK